MEESTNNDVVVAEVEQMRESARRRDRERRQNETTPEREIRLARLEQRRERDRRRYRERIQNETTQEREIHLARRRQNYHARTARGLYQQMEQEAQDSIARLVEGSFQGHTGHVDGKSSDARFNHQKGVTMDDKGNVYVADTLNLAIGKIGEACLCNGSVLFSVFKVYSECGFSF